MTEQHDADAGYSTIVGDRIRTIRRQKRLSLQEVEARSEAEFKASVLGAYERGERSISVPRLHRLAMFYNVPVEQLLPLDSSPGPSGAKSTPSKRDAVLELGGNELVLQQPKVSVYSLDVFLRLAG